MITGGTDGVTRVWSVDGLKQRHKMKGHKSTMYASAFHPGGKLAATASSGGLLHIWDVEKGKSVRKIEVGGRLNGLAFSADGSLLYGAGLPGVLVFETATGKRRANLAGPKGAVRSMALNTNRNLLVATGPGGVRIFDLKTGKVIRQMPVTSEEVYPVALHPTRPIIAAGSRHGNVLVWNSDTGALLQRHKAHKGVIMGLAFDKEGRTLATGAGDKLIRLWKVLPAKKKTRI